MELPQAFKEKMERLLGAEYTEFLESYEKERKQGLRLNLLKTSRKKFEQEAPFSLSPIPWTEEGYYYGKEDRPGLHPTMRQGCTISRSQRHAVVSLLDPKPGERILDLCAAPGGKTSHIASRLQGRGFLAANEIHPARAKILSQNVERMGIGNCAVFNETPDRLLRHFPEYFDRIVTDAPCSGEGMFRRMRRPEESGVRTTSSSAQRGRPYFRLRGRNAEAGRNHSVLDLYLFSGGGRAGSGGLFGPPSGISYQRSEKAGGPVMRRTSVGSQRAAGAGARQSPKTSRNSNTA